MEHRIVRRGAHKRLLAVGFVISTVFVMVVVVPLAVNRPRTPHCPSLRQWLLPTRLTDLLFTYRTSTMTQTTGHALAYRSALVSLILRLTSTQPADYCCSHNCTNGPCGPYGCFGCDSPWRLVTSM